MEQQQLIWVLMQAGTNIAIAFLKR